MPFDVAQASRPGLDEQADTILKKWVVNGIFSQELSGYRMALLLAIKMELDPEQIKKFKSKYNMNQVHETSAFCEVISAKYNNRSDKCNQDKIHILMSELASAGIIYMKENIIKDDLNIDTKELFATKKDIDV